MKEKKNSWRRYSQEKIYYAKTKEGRDMSTEWVISKFREYFDISKVGAGEIL